ncbi:hypothetical protein MGN70_014313 [Eutypa lata]|nr:hypothetical protein MGN70_014313 [Eutypa lata]
MAGAAKRTPTITVLGSLNIDLVSYVSHHPLPGETMTSNRFSVSPGGKGANQAVACAKLSRPRSSASNTTGTGTGTDRHAASQETAHVRMVGAVGDASAGDGYGDLLVTNLRSQGVDTSGVVRPAGQKTGIAIIVVDEPTGQNRIILSPEANHFLQPGHFDDISSSSPSSPSSSSIVVSLSNELSTPRPDLLIMQLEIPVPTVLRALRAARDGGVPVLLNPAPAVPLPAEAYVGLAHLVVNETEAAILGGASEADLETEAGLEAVARKFLARGVRNVVVTLGGRGVYYMSSSSSSSSGSGSGSDVGDSGGKGSGEVVVVVVKKGLVPAEKAKVVDTTAAGDTFVGVYALEAVLAAASSSGATFDVEAAVRKANRASAKTVERRGAQDSIPWRDELGW